MSDTTNNDGPYDSFKRAMTETFEKGIELLESEQSKVNKGFFEALTPAQRDTFCQTLDQQGVKSKRIEKITGKSPSTINRHLNGKNS